MAEENEIVVEQEKSEPPEWVAERFRNAENPIEAQARSYEEAQREMNRIRAESERERREFSEALQSLSAQEEQRVQQMQQQQYTSQADPLLNAAARAYEEGDTTTFLAIQAQISQAATAQIIDQRLGQFQEQFQSVNTQDREVSLRLAEEQVQRVFGEEQWSELAPKVQEALSAAPLPPTPSVEGYAAHLLQVAKVVDYDRLTAQNRALEEERTAKLNAQTLDNGGSRVPLTAPKNDDAWERIRNADAGGWNQVLGNG